MRRRATIEDADTAGRVRLAEEVPSSPQWDLQDALIAASVLLAETAAIVIWWPAALILGSILCALFALLIERDRARQTKAILGNPQ